MPTTEVHRPGRYIFTMPSQIREGLAQLAERTGDNISDVIRRACREHLEKELGRTI